MFAINLSNEELVYINPEFVVCIRPDDHNHVHGYGTIELSNGTILVGKTDRLSRCIDLV